MNNMKKIIEQFTIEGNTFGLAKILLEQNSETCPCELPKRDFTDTATEKGYTTVVDGTEYLKFLKPPLGYKWDGTGEIGGDGCSETYEWSKLIFVKPNLPDYHDKEVKTVVDAMVLRQDYTVQDIPEICRVYKLLELIEAEKKCQRIYTGTDDKSGTLKGWKEAFCVIVDKLWNPPDDAQDAGLKSMAGLVIFQLPNGDLKDVLHRKFEDAVAVQLGFDPSNKTSSSYTEAINRYTVPYETSDEWFDDGRKKGPAVGSYKAFGVKFDKLPPDSKYRSENLQIINLNHPLIIKLYGDGSSSEEEIIKTDTKVIQTNPEIEIKGKYDDIPWL